MFCLPIEIRYVPIIWTCVSILYSQTSVDLLGRDTALEASDSTALKATVLPMLMSETIHTNTAVATMALAGTWKCGLTLRDNSYQQAAHMTISQSTHCPKPLGKGQAVIACEGEHLA
jgi:hypothetical protein